MSVSGVKTALFIDGANLHMAAKSLGFDIDYKRLLGEFQSRGYLLRAFYYTAVVVDQEHSLIRPLIGLARLQRLHSRDQGVRRSDRSSQDQKRARRQRHRDRQPHRSHGAVLR